MWSNIFNKGVKSYLTLTDSVVNDHFVDLVCAEHCNKCDVNGERKCDEDECTNGFHYNGVTKICDVNGEFFIYKINGTYV